ncbi:hypothetical protein LB503_000093 [Fusarium chuoi]|nr:hypothetical protein LB503_000093 [Fusarium chuoi]
MQPALQREGNGFVSHPSVIQDHTTQPIHREGRWCRVIQLDGLANITAGLMEEKCTRYNSMTVWKLLFQDNQLNSSKGHRLQRTCTALKVSRGGHFIFLGTSCVRSPRTRLSSNLRGTMDAFMETRGRISNSRLLLWGVLIKSFPGLMLSVTLSGQS